MRDTHTDETTDIDNALGRLRMARLPFCASLLLEKRLPVCEMTLDCWGTRLLAQPFDLRLMRRIWRSTVDHRHDMIDRSDTYHDGHGGRRV